MEGFRPRGWISDPLVDCLDCKNRFREDTAEKNKQGEVVCTKCGSTNLTEPRNFNLMFETTMGAVKDDASTVYLRPETAQGIFVNFLNVQSSMRKKIPFGIAQIGKSFRNEITPGNFTFRTREFEQMEMQYFVKPGSDEQWFETWKQTRKEFYDCIGIRAGKLRFSEHGPGELAHYAKAAFDVQYQFPIGWQELEGIHNRTDFDLSQHQKFSGKKLEYFDEVAKQKYIPYVIETALGCDRLVLTILCDAYREEVRTLDNGKVDTRVVLKMQPQFSPVKVAILPLSKKPDLQSIASNIYEQLSKDLEVEYDEAGSIGKRYRRQDEIGTPLCVTIDFDSLEDKAVTVRHRDTMEQERINIDQVKNYINQKLASF